MNHKRYNVACQSLPVCPAQSCDDLTYKLSYGLRAETFIYRNLGQCTCFLLSCQFSQHIPTQRSGISHGLQHSPIKIQTVTLEFIEM